MYKPDSKAVQAALTEGDQDELIDYLVLFNWAESSGGIDQGEFDHDDIEETLIAIEEVLEERGFGVQAFLERLDREFEEYLDGYNELGTANYWDRGSRLSRESIMMAGGYKSKNGNVTPTGKKYITFSFSELPPKVQGKVVTGIDNLKAHIDSEDPDSVQKRNLVHSIGKSAGQRWRVKNPNVEADPALDESIQQSLEHIWMNQQTPMTNKTRELLISGWFAGARPLMAQIELASNMEELTKGYDLFIQSD